MPTREMVDGYVAVNDRGESSYDSEIGWIPRDHQSHDGVDGSVTFYSYEADRGRRIVNFPDGDSRIHTYGDSFTHCDQVSDGETWQEYLAAHLQEPIRNFGIGGHSVYQAYRRMRVVEPENPAEYLVLNAWSDDHWRNLDAWRSIRMARPRWTLPHLRVNIEAGTFEELDNPHQTPEDVYRMCDADYVLETYGDDPVMRAVAAKKSNRDLSAEEVVWIADGFGFSEDAFSDLSLEDRVEKMHREAALFATRCVIEMAEAFARQNDRQLLIILSFGRSHVQEALEGKPLFDQTLLDWIADREVPVIDLRDAFRANFERHQVGPDDYVEPFYNGHHTPRGNFFFAWAIKERIVEWLEPTPLPYL